MNYHNYRDLMPETNQAQVICLGCHHVESTRRILEDRWGVGCKRLSGIAGAPGRLTHDSETLDPRQIAAFITPVDGSNTFQGRLQGISSRLNEGSEVGFILTVFFDSLTAARLSDYLYGSLGKTGTVAAGSSVTIVVGEPPTT